MNACRRRIRVTREQIELAKRVLQDVCRPFTWRPLATPGTVRPTTRPARTSLHGGTVLDHAAFARACVEGFLLRPRTAQTAERYLAVLQRFGSFTPLLRPSHDYALGGGYLLAYEGLGIGIDPGHNFLQNLFASGHSLNDIDYVAITHAHDDHMTDLIGLHSLLHQQRKLQLRRAKVGLFWSRGAARYFRGSQSSRQKDFREVILKPFTTHRFGPCGGHRLTVLPAKHTDLTGSRGIGIALTLRSRAGRTHTVLYTGDTGWSPEVGAACAERGTSCDLLLLHMGGIGPTERHLLEPGARLRDCLYKQHLGLIGATLLLDAVRPRVAVVGEFGEELDGLEHAVVGALQREFHALGVRVEAAQLYERYSLDR